MKVQNMNGETMIPMDVTVNGKRKLQGEVQKKNKKSKHTDNKNVLMVLNDHFPGIQYVFSSAGTPQSPEYKVCADVNGASFVGNGPSKGAAKRDLAANALARLLNIIISPEQEMTKNIPQFSTQIGDTPKPLMFSGTPLYTFNNGAFVQIADDITNRPTIDEEKARSHPVMVLSEVFPSVQLDWMEGSGHGNRQFKVEAEVQGRKFFGVGRSKKLAKLSLAKTILLCMYDIHDFKEIEPAEKPPKVMTDEALFEKKYPITKLKTLIGEDEINIDVIKLEPTGDEGKMFHATIVVKGVAYEAVGKNRNVAKLHAAKKALGVLRPKKEDTPTTNNINANGVDTSRHPIMVFQEMFKDVKFVESESKGENNVAEHKLEVEIGGKVFKTQESSKKKAKLRLILNVFEQLKHTPSTEWSTVDIKNIF